MSEKDGFQWVRDTKGRIIGGLNKDNIDVLAGIPIAGICVVSAIMKADDPKTAAEELKARAQELGLC